jgi:hypothetical protein
MTKLSNEVVISLKAQLAWLERQKKPDQVVRLSYGGAFGVLHALRVSPEGSDFLSIHVLDDGGTDHVIVAPVSQCSFKFSVITPSAGKREPKVILGFAEGREKIAEP